MLLLALNMDVTHGCVTVLASLSLREEIIARFCRRRRLMTVGLKKSQPQRRQPLCMG
jgi:hypothetical protein